MVARNIAAASAAMPTTQIPHLKPIYLLFEQSMAKLAPEFATSDITGITIAVAVSGGSDSMALALLAQQYCHEKNIALTAMIVDHKLRAESSIEAEKTSKWLDRRGIKNHILQWQHDSICGNLQAAARKARYQLLTACCNQLNIKYLLLGHTQDDQAETIAMCQNRNAGIIGLSGMSARRDMNNISILRPLLNHSRQQLRILLQQQQQQWIDDPSNENMKFTRIKIRKQLEHNPAQKQELLLIGRKMAVKRIKLQNIANDWLEKYANYEHGKVVYNRAKFIQLADIYPEINTDDLLQLADTDNNNHLTTKQENKIMLSTLQYIILNTALQLVGGNEYPPRFAKAQLLYSKLYSSNTGKHSLAHCIISWKDDLLLIEPETDTHSRQNNDMGNYCMKQLVVPPFYHI